jgi:hypothetical protein
MSSTTPNVLEAQNEAQITLSEHLQVWHFNFEIQVADVENQLAGSGMLETSRSLCHQLSSTCQVPDMGHSISVLPGID